MSLLAHHHALLRAATSHRPDTLAHLAAYAAVGYVGFDLDLIDQVHEALEAAGLAAGRQLNRHFSAAPFGVRLTGQNEVQNVACLFRNPLQPAGSINPVLLQPGGWRNRDRLYYDQAAMMINPLAFDVQGEATVAALGDFGAAPTSGAIVVELTGDFGILNAWAMAVEAELYMGSRTSGFNIASEGTPYAPAPRLAVGRLNVALPPAQQVQLRRNGQDTTGRLYNLIENQSGGAYPQDNLYVGGRHGTSLYLNQASVQAVFVANRRLTDSQLAILQPLSNYYNL